MTKLNEELLQRNYLHEGKLKGEAFGPYEKLNIGSTTVKALESSGVKIDIPSKIPFPFQFYKMPVNPGNAKPDEVFLLRKPDALSCVAVVEHKSPSELSSDKKSKKVLKASEQSLFHSIVLGAKIAVVTNDEFIYYINVSDSIDKNEIVYYNENRPTTHPVLTELLAEKTVVRSNSELGGLAERVWQHIWHATKDEPKQCLLTFVEFFVFKFLSDNLADAYLAKNYKFYTLLEDDFAVNHGNLSQIEYYNTVIRPEIKKIFPDNIICDDASIGQLFGLGQIVSKASVINGFSFFKSSKSSSASFNKVFMDILKAFDEFGSLCAIEPEFKLRLYETFLKKSARQSKLGQFFTPRNVVQAIIKMAEMDKLREGAVVLDPAAGVGGFVLEPTLLESFENNVTFDAGKPCQKVKLIGVDVDFHTHILAKANTLIHYAETIRDSRVTPAVLNKLMARMFILMDGNETLGSLEYPPRNSIDLIMTNPPYVTQGSRIYKEAIAELTSETESGNDNVGGNNFLNNSGSSRNNENLENYYSNCGLGLESLFLRYISGALKPGGKAFVIVPQGMLTRTESGTKAKILSECNLLASIALPKNTFFNTPQKTYIIVLEKRYTPADSKPGVFCAIAKSIGETLDYRRRPTPEDNILDLLAKQFVSLRNTYPSDMAEKSNDEMCDKEGGNAGSVSKYFKMISPDEFSASDRWDVLRFWDDKELVDIGEREPALDPVVFIDDIENQIAEVSKELTDAKLEIQELSSFNGKLVNIGDETHFTVRRGKRVRREDCDLYPGEIPVYSGSQNQFRPLGKISEQWLENNHIPVENNSTNTDALPIVTVNANGYVGAVFVRREKCVIHDDVMIIEIKRRDIFPEFLALQLEGAIAEGNFEYEAKLYNRVKQLSVKLPVLFDDENTYDETIQKQISEAVKRLSNLRQRLYEIGSWSKQVRLQTIEKKPDEDEPEPN